MRNENERNKNIKTILMFTSNIKNLDVVFRTSTYLHIYSTYTTRVANFKTMFDNKHLFLYSNKHLVDVDLHIFAGISLGYLSKI